MRDGSLRIAALASLGAGAIHAAAISAHREHPQALVVFALVAAFQVGWGALALTNSHPRLALVGALGNTLVLGGWVIAKVTGLWMIEGLDGTEAVGLADSAAAALALVAVAGAVASARGVSRRRPAREVRPTLVAVCAIGVAAVTLPGIAAADDHVNGDAHDHGSAARPYDPSDGVDLSGVPGVTPEQQSRAEDLVEATLRDLPKYADPATAVADGFHTIGDAQLGEEHFINWSYVNDDRVLDPEYPESLVYRVRSGTKTLVAAMFTLADGTTFADAPDVGGPLTQWHVHNDLCFTPDDDAPVIAREPLLADGTCRPPLRLRVDMPMLHVWIVPNKCGPFAALEGFGAGQIEPGQERWCDHVHGEAAPQ